MSLDPAQRLELILQQLDQLPTLPSVAVRILELTSSERSAAKDVVRLIESDAALTARILRIIHRADGGTRIDIASVERAVVMLGFEAVRNAVLAVSVFEVMGPSSNDKNPGSGRRFNREEFWKHNVGVACCSELLARRMKIKLEPSDAFLAGLLHDLGKVALDSALPKSYARVIEAVELVRGDIADLERRIIGVDHLVVGKRVAERWTLPAFLRDVIWLHGQSVLAIPPSVKQPHLVHIVTLADQLVRRQHIGYSGNFSSGGVSETELLEALGLTSKDVDAVLAELVAAIEPRATALGLGQSTSEDLYRQALSRANTELGRLTDQLSIKNKKLAVRAKFFESLSQFHGELRPDAPPAAVLQAIAHTAASVIGVERCGAFSLSNHASRVQAHVVVARADGECVEIAMEQSPELAPEMAGENSPGQAGEQSSEQAIQLILPQQPTSKGEQAKNILVRPIDKSLEWVIQTTSPRLSGSRQFWIPLTSDGVVIGGVVFGGDIGSDHRVQMQHGELGAIAGGWSLALRTCQIREESNLLSEQLADANRLLQGTQQELLTARTLSSMGELAAGAAHEMNNPLTVISGRSQLLAVALRGGADAKLSASASIIAEQAQRLSDIITDLMHFARPVPVRSENCAIDLLIEDAIREAKTLAKVPPDSDDRNIVVQVNQDVPPVMVDKRQVTGAIAQIIANALQAAEVTSSDQTGDHAGDHAGDQAGDQAGNRAGDSGKINITAAFDRFGKQVVVNVDDQGAGMDQETLKHAFDPFYSAKPAGRSRGMGLAKSLRWIKASGGTIRLESLPGEGTKVTVVLPVGEEPIQTQIAQSA